VKDKTCMTIIAIYLLTKGAFIALCGMFYHSTGAVIAGLSIILLTILWIELYRRRELFSTWFQDLLNQENERNNHWY
jgi:hypothetical protein